MAWGRNRLGRQVEKIQQEYLPKHYPKRRVLGIIIPTVEVALKDPKIKAGRTDQDKPTVFIEHASLPKEEKWKKFFIFEDEIKTVAEIMYQLTSQPLLSNVYL